MVLKYVAEGGSVEYSSGPYMEIRHLASIFYCFVVQSSGTGAHAVPVEAEMYRPALCLGEEVERQPSVSAERVLDFAFSGFE